MVEVARQCNLPIEHGIIVREVDKDNPAARAAIRAGDIVIALDGKPIANWKEFIRELFSRRPGDLVRMEVVRDGTRRR